MSKENGKYNKDTAGRKIRICGILFKGTRYRRNGAAYLVI